MKNICYKKIFNHFVVVVLGGGNPRITFGVIQIKSFQDFTPKVSNVNNLKFFQDFDGKENLKLSNVNNLKSFQDFENKEHLKVSNLNNLKSLQDFDVKQTLKGSNVNRKKNNGQSTHDPFWVE